MGLGRVLHGIQPVAGYLVDHPTKSIRMENRLGQTDEVRGFDHVCSGSDVSVIYFDLQLCMD